MDAQYYQSLPKKRMASGALIFNESGELLIVNPTYKDGWAVPGGVVEEGESPRNACIREIKEELGVTISNPMLLGVEYTNEHTAKGEALQFIFYGGILTNQEIASVTLPPWELSEFKFVPPNAALPLLPKKLQTRISKCLTALRNPQLVYLENGEE